MASRGRRRRRAGLGTQIAARVIYLIVGAIFVLFAMAMASSLGPAFVEQISK